MSDFVTLTCPSCGGKLEISQSTLSLVCQHCGVEHLVRREAGNILLETFVRCPMCKRNDRAEKVSAVANGQSSKVAEKLSQPPAPALPNEPSGFGWWWLIIWYPAFFVAALPALPIMLLYNSIGNDSYIVVMAIVVDVIFIYMIIKVFKWLIAKSKQLKENRKKQSPYQEEYIKYEKENANWEKAVENWKRLYYCSRDDIVYDPDTNKTCDPDKIRDFIYGL